MGRQLDVIESMIRHQWGRNAYSQSDNVWRALPRGSPSIKSRVQSYGAIAVIIFDINPSADFTLLLQSPTPPLNYFPEHRILKLRNQNFEQIFIVGFALSKQSGRSILF